MIRHLQLLGQARRTHDGYLREVRKLACHFGQAPDPLTESQVADYLLHLINDRKLAPGTLPQSRRQRHQVLLHPHLPARLENPLQAQGPQTEYQFQIPKRYPVTPSHRLRASGYQPAGSVDISLAAKDPV